jgi:hypothetical protein
LPTIEKDGLQKLVDLPLLYELFFVGQDKRNPSNVINTGYYNKQDFANMIYSLAGCLTFNDSIELDMIELPDGIQSITVKNGDFRSDKLTKLPDGISIKANKRISFNNLTTMGDNITIEAGMNIFFKCLTTIGDDVTIKAVHTIILDTLTTIGNNARLETGIDIWLNGLKTIGNNVTIKAKGRIMFTDTYTGLTEITLTDDGTVPNEMKQFLTDKKITVKCPETSPLVNLAFEGVLVKIAK